MLWMYQRVMFGPAHQRWSLRRTSSYRFDKARNRGARSDCILHRVDRYFSETFLTKSAQMVKHTVEQMREREAWIADAIPRFITASIRKIIEITHKKILFGNLQSSL